MLAVDGIRTYRGPAEILRGVSTLKPLALSPNLFADDFRRSLARDDDDLLARSTHPAHFAAFREVPWHLARVVRAAQSQVATRTPYFDNDIVALAFRASEAAIRSSMPARSIVRHKHAALSVIPTDQGLVPASRLLSFTRRFWYGASFKLEYWYGDGMPHWLSRIEAGLTPRGIHVAPPGLHKYLDYARWFRKDLASYVCERLNDLATSRQGFWNRRFLAQAAEDHIAGRNNHLKEINTVLTLESTARLLLGRSFDAVL